MKNRCLQGGFKVKKTKQKKQTRLTLMSAQPSFFFQKPISQSVIIFFKFCPPLSFFCICCVHEMFPHCYMLFFVFHLIWWPFSYVSIWLRSVSHFNLHYCQTKMQTFHKPPSHTVSAPGLHCTLEV